MGKYLTILIFFFCCACSAQFTLYGFLQNSAGQAYDDKNILFSPTNNPNFKQNPITLKGSLKITSNGGYFVVHLTPGPYVISFSSGDRVQLYIPPTAFPSFYSFTYFVTNIVVIP
jgi:hypothetical protein